MFFGRITQSIIHFFKLLFSDDYMMSFFSEYFLYSTIVIKKGLVRNFFQGDTRQDTEMDGSSIGNSCIYVIVPLNKKYSNQSCVHKVYAIDYFYNIELSLYCYETNSNYSFCLGSTFEARRILLWFYIFGTRRTYKSKYKNIELLSLGG